jgi:hypothetical protein
VLEEELRQCKRRLKCSVQTTEWKVSLDAFLATACPCSELVLDFGCLCPKDRIIARKGCFHMCSKMCIDTLIKTRNRKCPICANPFDNKDVQNIVGLSPEGYESYD